MNAVDILMGADLNIEKKKGKLVLKLQKVGIEIEFECAELSTDVYSKIEAMAINMYKDERANAGLLDYRINIILNGCSLFSNKQLLEKFSCPTPKELVLKLLNYEEITALSDYILSLTSSNVVSSDDVKN